VSGDGKVKTSLVRQAVFDEAQGGETPQSDWYAAGGWLLVSTNEEARGAAPMDKATGEHDWNV
jgi:hypothetical protein